MRRRVCATGAFALLLAGGCRLFERHFGAVLSTFPHDVHTTSAGASCADCHGQDSKRPGFPTAETCASCHDLSEEAVAVFFEGGEARWVRAGRLPGEIIFDHDVHAAPDETGCRACHEAVAAADAIYDGAGTPRYDCLECHQKPGGSAPLDCLDCHREIRRTTAPDSHRAGWMERHGPRWRTRTGAHTADRCELCHPQGACDTCHTTRRPRSHTEYFRGRGHGIEAGIDRERCYICHRRDTCDRCHSRARPRSHRGSFGAPSNRHCMVCHLPVDLGEHCGVCHRDTPSHDQAEALPADAAHLTSTPDQCRACHRPVPHPDNGDNCRFCHR